MNFLLGASLIIWLLFPGLFFNRGFSFSMVEDLLFSLVPILFIHLLCLPVTLAFGLQFDELYLIVISDKTESGAVTRGAVYGF